MVSPRNFDLSTPRNGREPSDSDFKSRKTLSSLPTTSSGHLRPTPSTRAPPWPEDIENNNGEYQVLVNYIRTGLRLHALQTAVLIWVAVEICFIRSHLGGNASVDASDRRNQSFVWGGIQPHPSRSERSIIFPCWSKKSVYASVVVWVAASAVGRTISIILRCFMGVLLMPLTFYLLALLILKGMSTSIPPLEFLYHAIHPRRLGGYISTRSDSFFALRPKFGGDANQVHGGFGRQEN